MPIRQGYEMGAVLQSGNITGGLSGDMNQYEFTEWDPSAFLVCDREEYSNGWRLALLIATSYTQLKNGYILKNWGDDFYDRIYITPTFINLGTIVTPQTRNVELWNAYRYVEAQLNEIIIDGTPLEVDGPAVPFAMRPLAFQIFSVTVNSTGAPNVNSEITFDFDNVPNPDPVVVVGTRAIRFDIIPEVPVRERWSWLTDVMVATDGTEQRVSLRGEVPRVEIELKSIFTSIAQINTFYAQLLLCQGRLWIPEYQYATKLTQASPIATDMIYFDAVRTDVRAGEYVLIQGKTEFRMVEVLALTPTGAQLAAPLDTTFPKGSLLVTGSPSIIDDPTGLDRYAVDHAAETNIRAQFVRTRATLTRPDADVTLPTFLGDVVLDKRPLANSLVGDSVSTGQKAVDNQTGIPDIITRWEYSRIEGDRQFKVDRVQDPETMDYWKAILATAQGKCRMFWVPTFRQDLFLEDPLTGGDTTATLQGADYYQRIFQVPTHHYLEFETAAGIHRVTVTNAADNLGNSGINFTPAFPIGTGWTDVKRISYILPIRLADDNVDWEHYGLESLLSLSIRTAEPPQ